MTGNDMTHFGLGLLEVFICPFALAYLVRMVRIACYWDL